MEPIPEIKTRTHDDEIDLVEIVRQIWAGRWIILATLVVFVIPAIIYIFYKSNTAVKEFESKVTLFAESPSPDSLLKIIKNPPFLSEVLKTKLTGLTTGSTLTVMEVLKQQTKPPQGTIGALMNRINGSKDNSGILTISVMMQNGLAATQLTDSVVQKLAQFLKETQVKRNEKFQQLLHKDSLRNIQHLLKGSSKNIQFLTEASSKNIQILTAAYLKAESIYLQSQQALSEFYNRNSKNLKSIDSIEVKRLNSDIKMKFNVYSALYQQLNQAKIDAQGKFEQAKLDAEKQLDQSKTDAKKQIEQVELDAEKQKPAINVLEPSTVAIQVSVPNKLKVPLLMLFFGLITGIGIVFGKNFILKNSQIPPPK